MGLFGSRRRRPGSADAPEEGAPTASCARISAQAVSHTLLPLGMLEPVTVVLSDLEPAS